MATNPLLDLPHELIESVAGFLPAADLAHLAATCRGLNGICEPLLYATATLDDLEAAAGFGEALAALPVRAKQVVSLQVRSMPFCGDGKDSAGCGAGSPFRWLDLQCLTRCVVRYFVAYDYWDASLIHPLLTHPTLLSLTVQDASFPDLSPASTTPSASPTTAAPATLAPLSHPPHLSTPLRSLFLVNCSVPPSALQALLDAPARLRSLCLDNVYYTPEAQRPTDFLAYGPVGLVTDAIRRSRSRGSIACLSLHLAPSKVEFDTDLGPDDGVADVDFDDAEEEEGTARIGDVGDKDPSAALRLAPFAALRVFAIDVASLNRVWARPDPRLAQAQAHVDYLHSPPLAASIMTLLPPRLATLVLTSLWTNYLEQHLGLVGDPTTWTAAQREGDPLAILPVLAVLKRAGRLPWLQRVVVLVELGGDEDEWLERVGGVLAAGFAEVGLRTEVHLVDCGMHGRWVEERFAGKF